jgi:hypothetical protein
MQTFVLAGERPDFTRWFAQDPHDKQRGGSGQRSDTVMAATSEDIR